MSKITVDVGIEIEVKYGINDVGKVLRGIKKVFSCRAMGMNVKRRLSNALYEIETYGVWQ